jgi:TatD DNase family protein
MFLLIDTHIHLDASELDGSGAALIPAAVAAGISHFLIPGVRVADWRALLELARQHQELLAAPGLHPAYAEQWSADAELELRELVRQSKVVAIGEIGLDGVNGPSLEQQERVLRAQLQIAFEAQLPVMLHGRKATGRLLDILRELQVGERIGGIWHGFSGSRQVAQELVHSGIKLGVGPILLRESARKLPEVVRQLPLESMVLETDLPDMAARPEVLLQVAERIAQLRGLSVGQVAATTTAAAKALFRI